MIQVKAPQPAALYQCSMAAAALSQVAPKDESPSFEIVRLNSGHVAVRAPFRPHRPILVYGFRDEGQAWAWIERMKARLAK